MAGVATQQQRKFPEFKGFEVRAEMALGRDGRHTDNQGARDTVTRTATKHQVDAASASSITPVLWNRSTALS
jgi:hypothetical protein